MKKINLFLFLLLLLAISHATYAQQGEVADDSGKLSQMEKVLEEARMNEMNLRMEIEQLQIKMSASDSLRKEQKRHRIDSLRKVTPKIPVVVEKDTLYYLYAKHGGRSPRDRAKNISDAILQLGKRYLLKPDSV
jgi:hypothetical protein